MKKIIRFNLVLTGVIAILLAITAAKPATRGVTILTMPYLFDCYHYYIISGYTSSRPCDASCPAFCSGGHLIFNEDDRVFLKCPPPFLFNTWKECCDWPENINCPHTEKCYNFE